MYLILMVDQLRFSKDFLLKLPLANVVQLRFSLSSWLGMLSY